MSDVLQFTALFAGPATTPLRQAIEYAQTGPFGTQLTADEYIAGGVPVINPTHIQRGHIAPDDSTTVTPEKAEDLARYRLAVGDIVLGRKGEVDKSALVNQQSEGYVCGSDAMALRPRLGTVPDYLWWFLQSSEAHSQLEFWSVGSTVSGLNQNTIRKVRLPLPDVQEQQRIADYLDRESAGIDTLIEEQQRLIEMLRQRRADLISHLVLNATSERTQLRRLVDVIDCAHVTAEFVEDDVRFPVASIRECQGPTVDLSACNYTTAEFFEHLRAANRSPRAGDLLFIRNVSVGLVSVATSDLPEFAIGQETVLLRRKSDVHPSFLRYALVAAEARYAIERAMIGSTFRRINVSAIRSLPVPAPPLDEQRRIAAYLNEQTTKMDDLIAESERFIELSKERRAALITSAVTGQIDVREAA